MTQSTRRKFLGAAAAGGAASLGDFSFLSQLNPVSAQDAKVSSKVVELRPEIQPLVRLIEETPRARLIDAVAGKIRKGTSYQEILAALFLAGVRNVEPRPYVGFKFHAVLVVNSAHLASLAAPDSERWLPIFWALDEFKASQARDVQEGNWTMAPVDESAVPSAEKTHDAFVNAMTKWDVSLADGAAAGLARHAGAAGTLELFSRFAARDFRSIGHKAIFVANSWRTLQVIGWKHSEPILRSLAYALVNHRGEPNPAENDLAPDRPGRENAALAKKIRAGWLKGKLDSTATTKLLATLRSGSPSDASQAVVEMLNAGVSPQSVYDALHTGAGELLMRQPGIVGLHAVTTTNAIRFLFGASGNEETRKMLLLQNAAFLPMFREAMRSRGRVADGAIDRLEAASLDGSPSEQIESIFGDVSGDRTSAAKKILSYLNEENDARELINSARQLIFQKGTSSHDYKFSSAVLEDFYKVSPAWRNQFLATSAFNLKGNGHRDNPLIARTREALG